MQSYLIIGNGIAAAGCIEGIRERDAEGKITVVSKENHPVYCRPLISYYLEGKTDLKKMMYRRESFYRDMKCEVIYGKSVVKLDEKEHTAHLSDGSKISYTKACLATGSVPFLPPMRGIEKVKNKFSFMTVDDMLAIEKAVSEKSRVLIVGAGLIGLKCAEGLADRVADITVCDLADRILSSILDEECAAPVMKHMEKHGTEFMLGDTVEEFDENRATMKSGRTVEFDVLVTAVGVRADTVLMRDTEAKIGRGVTVDNKMKTDAEDIYAAGDCTESTDISSGQKKVMALLPSAYMQGKCAGINMAGGSETLENEIPMNSIGFFGMHIMTAGTYFTVVEGGKTVTLRYENGIRKFYLKDGFLRGFIFVGKTERAGIFTALIRNRQPISEVDFELLKKNSDYTGFSSENRRKIFGGVV